MKKPSSPTATKSGSLTTALLGLIVLLCAGLIGGAGFIKYNIDQSIAALNAPAAPMGASALAAQIRVELGFSGFLGAAQNFADQHDEASFNKLKNNLKNANDLLSKLPAHTAPDLRRDVEATVNVFNRAFRKIETAAGNNVTETTIDLTPLYAALPMLDTRLTSTAAEAKLPAQDDLRTWSMALTILSLGASGIAVAFAVALIFSRRDRVSAPLAALTQSIQNMARGDMRTAVWGIERQDMIGEVARAADMARYHFSALPDVSLMSDQGPVRMRFEGGSRSLFEAMMKAISKDAETVGAQAATLTASAQMQKDAIEQLTSKVEDVLQNVLHKGQNGDTQIQKAVQDITSSTENLKNVHAHAADQLSRLIPQMQERMQGMAEIAQITGKQVASTLQSLTLSEMGLKTNTEQVQETLNKLSSTADDLGARLFGAINLLQASGKVLSETTERIQSSIAEQVNPKATLDPESLSPLIERLNDLTSQMDSIQDKLDTPAGEGETTLDHIQDKLEILSAAVSQQVPAPDADTLLSGMDRLLSEKVSPRLDSVEQNITDRLQAKFADLNASLDEQVDSRRAGEQELKESLQALLSGMADKLAAAPQAAPEPVDTEAFGRELSVLSERITAMGEAFGLKIDETLAARLDRLEDVIERLGNGSDAATREDLRQALAETAQVLQTPIAAIPEVLRHSLEGNWRDISTQVDTLRSTLSRLFEEQVAEKLSAVDETMAATRETVEAARIALETPPKAIVSLSPEIQAQMHDQWYQVTRQIEAARASLADAVAHQVGELSHALTTTAAKAVQTAQPISVDAQTQKQLEQQTEILSELVATLGVLDEHMQQIKTDIRPRAIA